jgi:hypothetical protein
MEAAMNVKRFAATLLTVVSIVGLAPAPARAWNAVSHAWIVRELHRSTGHLTPADPNRLYGAAAPDLFQSHFTATWSQLQALLHDPGTEALLKAWRAADGRAEHDFAYGMLTHGNGWGADNTAHLSARTTGHDQGYIIAKAALLAPQMAPLLAQAGLVLPDDVLLLVCHILVEQGVDLQLVAFDPTIAPALLEAASVRDGSIPDFLAGAWAKRFAAIVGSEAEAAAFIVAAEAEFRWTTAGYAWALTQPNGRALVVAGIGNQAEEFLGLPAGYGAALAPLIDYGLTLGMALTAGDWRRELGATAGWVDRELDQHQIRPWSPPRWLDHR